MGFNKDNIDSNMARESRILRRELIPLKGHDENVVINVPMQFKMTKVLVGSCTDSVFINSTYFNRPYCVNSDYEPQTIRLGIHENPLDICAMDNNTQIRFFVPDHVASQHRITALFSISGGVPQEIMDAVLIQRDTQKLFKVELLNETVALENDNGSKRLPLCCTSLIRQNNVFTISPECLKKKAAGFRYDYISFDVKVTFCR